MNAHIRNVLLAFSLIIIATLSYLLYFSKVNFFKPVIIEINGITMADFNNIDCRVMGPLGHEFFLGKDSAKISFSGSYAYRKDIILNMPVSVSQKITELHFYHGEEKIIVNKNQLFNITQNKNDSVEMNLSDAVKVKNSVLLLLFSSVYWSGWTRIFYIVLLLIIVSFFLYCLYKKNQPLVLKFYRSIPFWLSQKQVRIALTLLLIVLYSAIFYNISGFTNGARFKNGEFEYHSAGVNLAKGHGISRIGAIEPFDQYKFNEYGNNVEFNYKYFTRFAGAYQFQNPPGYGIFLGVIYYVFGINPVIAKYIQLLLLIVIASVLPLMGYRYWKANGYVAGIIASVLFLSQYYQYARQLEPQCLLMFMLFLVIAGLDRYLKKPSYVSALILGFVIALSLLVKALIILFPAFIILYFLFKLLRSPKSKTVFQLLLFILGFISPFFPWSVYATQKARHQDITQKVLQQTLLNDPLNKTDSLFLAPIIAKDPKINNPQTILYDAGILVPAKIYSTAFTYFYGYSMNKKEIVLISTQFQHIAQFSAHNEYSKDGGFNVDWIFDKNSFYNNDNLQGRSPFFRVFNFYLHFPEKIITLPVLKLHRAFSGFYYLISFFIVIILNFLFTVVLKFHFIKKHNYLLLIFLPLIFLPFFMCVNVLFFCCILFLTAVSIILSRILRFQYDLIKIPPSFYLIIISLAVLIPLYAGDKRFTEVVDFLFILCNLYAIIALFLKYFFNIPAFARSTK
jgi:4-amino-4-deoxy-L-arabinose transferase-like glycosyltransferase